VTASPEEHKKEPKISKITESGVITFDFKKVAQNQTERTSNKVTVAIRRDIFEAIEKKGFKLGIKQTGVLVNKILEEVVRQV
jgi:phosphoribosylaminoimidazole carboxylase (NCAIR synthetase)